MKHFLKPTNLPVLAVGAGFLAQLLRRGLYALALDEKGLLRSGHPLEAALALLSLAVLAFLLLSVRKLDGSGAYEDNFFPSKQAKLGRLAAAAGIALTVLTAPVALEGNVGRLWMLLGALAPLCLGASALARGKGKQPHFLPDLAACLFLVLYLITQYRGWCSNPQLQDYVFALFGSVFLALFAFYTAAFSAGLPRRRMQLFTGLAAVYLLTAELATTAHSWLCLGGILWALTDLCTLEPRPKPEEPPKEGA